MASQYPHQDNAGQTYAGQQPHGNTASSAYYASQQHDEKFHVAQPTYEQHAFQQQAPHEQQQPNYWQPPPSSHISSPGQIHQQTYGGPPSGYPPADRKPKRYCGLKKIVFLALLACLGITLIAIGVGVGVGVSLSHRTTVASQTQSSPSSSSTATSSSTPTSSATKTSSGTSSTATPTAVTEVVCPTANNTVFTSTYDASKSFTHLCGIDYSGTGQAKDVGSSLTTSFSECLNTCASWSNCTGAGWGDMDDDKKRGDGKHHCYMKNSLQGSHAATASWNFGVLNLNAGA